MLQSRIKKLSDIEDAAMAKKETTDLQIIEVERGQIDYCILGRTPLILNRMSEKAMRQLISPPPKKTKGQLQETLKHDPYAEFLASAYTDDNPNGPTLITHLATAFKRAMSSAALDIPGATKSQIGRLSWVEGERLPIFGIPQMLMSVVRNSDANHTPDIRTRVIMPKWACRITVTYTKPLLNETNVTNLLVTAGMTQGVGDWRTQKGSGTYGSFDIVSADNPDYKFLLKNGTRKLQQAAMDSPVAYDRETEELYAWALAEAAKRGKSDMLTAEKSKRSKPKAVKVAV